LRAGGTRSRRAEWVDRLEPGAEPRNRKAVAARGGRVGAQAEVRGCESAVQRDSGSGARVLSARRVRALQDAEGLPQSGLDSSRLAANENLLTPSVIEVSANGLVMDEFPTY